MGSFLATFIDNQRTKAALVHLRSSPFLPIDFVDGEFYRAAVLRKMSFLFGVLKDKALVNRKSDICSRCLGAGSFMQQI